MSAKEIITVQVGHYASHVGAHLWNIQESSFDYNSHAASKKEICHDVLYREGQNLQRQITFTPRLIAFDLKGSLGTLKQEGMLYDADTDTDEIKWMGDVTLHKEASSSKISFLQNLQIQESSIHVVAGDDEDDGTEVDKEDEDTEKIVKKTLSKQDKRRPNESHILDFDNESVVWSDYLATNFHPKSIQIIEQYRHKNELQSFDVYTCGKEVFQNYEAFCQWEDRIHHFAEECDSLQGFHVLIDTHNGFGGLSESVLKYLEEEFPGKGILTFGFIPADVPDNTPLARATRIINSALSYESASTHSSLFVPASLRKGLWPSLGPTIEFEGLTYNTKAYHTSSILASVLDTLSLPYRLDGCQNDIRNLTHSLNIQGRKLAALNASLPLGLRQDESLVDFFSMLCRGTPNNPWQSLTPHIVGNQTPIMQSVVLRGVDETQVKSDMDPRKLPHYLTGVKTSMELLKNFMAERNPGQVFTVDCLNSPLKTAVPFPHIFKETVNRTGYLCGAKRGRDIRVESTPVITSVQCTPELEDVLHSLHKPAAKMNIKKHHRYIAGGLEEDDYVEVLESLKSLANNYRTNVDAY